MIWDNEWYGNFGEVLMRFFNLRIVFVVAYLILLMSVVVFGRFCSRCGFIL